MRMTHLYQSVCNMFGNPYYWAGKEHGYYSLFAEFHKVRLLVKMPQNTFTFWIVSDQLHWTMLLHRQAQQTARLGKLMMRETMRYQFLAPVLRWGVTKTLVVHFYSFFNSLLVFEGCNNEPLSSRCVHCDVRVCDIHASRNATKTVVACCRSHLPLSALIDPPPLSFGSVLELPCFYCPQTFENNADLHGHMHKMHNWSMSMSESNSSSTSTSTSTSNSSSTSTSTSSSSSSSSISSIVV